MLFKREKDLPEDIELNTRHVVLRTALFVLALIVAVTAFAVGITGIGRKEPGLYAVEAAPDDALPLYGGEMTLQYYLTGTSAENRETLKLLKEAYSMALKRAYILFDAKTEYGGWTNLATLNARPGETVELDGALFAALTDAYERTVRDEGYNVFAGPLYAAWEEVLYLEEPEPFDPLNNAETEEKLTRLAAAVNDPGNFRFEVVDASRRAVRFEYSDAVRALLEEYELPQTVLDLNILRDAYELRYVADALESESWNEGYLTTPSGMALSLSRGGAGEYRLYGSLPRGPLGAAKADAAPGSAFSQVRVFPNYEGEYGFYTVERDGAEVRRYPYLTASGAYPGTLECSCVLAPDGDVVSARWENLRLSACADEKEAELLAAASARPIAWILPDGGTTFQTNAAGADVYEHDTGETP